MKKFIVGSLLFLTSSLFSQNNNSFFELNSDSTIKWGVGAFGNFAIGSDAISNGFVNSFYTGQYITSAQKDFVENKMTRYNRIGGDANAGIYYLHKVDTFFHKKVFAWFVSMKSRQHLDILFTRDLFNIAFYGNSSYHGQMADFGGFSLNSLSYQQLQAGVVSDRYGVGISIYNGQQFQFIKAKNALMYTSTYGEYIDFNTAYSMIYSDPKSTAFGTLNGIGTGLDFYGRMPMELMNGKKGDLFVELSDLGFIRWNKKTEHYKNDTMYHFDGFAIRNVFQLADSSLHFTAKSVLNAKPFEKSAYASYLPATLDVKFVPVGIKYQFVLGIKYRFSSNYKPYSYGQFRYHCGKHFSFVAEVGFGGYANLQAGLLLNAVLGKEYSIHLGVNNIPGFIAPQYTCGQGLYVSVSKIFR